MTSHYTQPFKLSCTPRFVEKLVDVVGEYQDSPEKSCIFSVNEKPQTQARGRTQSLLLLRKDWPEGQLRDYRSRAMVDLFAALDILDGQVIP